MKLITMSNDFLPTENLLDGYSVYEPPISDRVFDALVDFIRKIQDGREGNDALTLAETKQIVMDLVQSLLEIAYQAMRTTAWTDRAMAVMSEIRREIDGLDNWGYYLDSLQWNLNQCSNKEYMDSVRAQFNLSEKEAVFSLKTLTIDNPELHNEYLSKLNYLLGFCFGYNRGSELIIAKQAVKIGRISCSLAHTLLMIIKELPLARRVAIYTVQFSVHLLIAPVLKRDFVICQNYIREEDREATWSVLRASAGYTEEDIARLKHYTIVGLNYPLHPNESVGFAVLNHDVSCPFQTSKSTIAVDFESPIVLIQHLWIRPDYRRLGAGNYLMKYIKTLAASNCYEAIAFAETTDVIRTLGFWYAVGFRPSVYLHKWYEIELNPQHV